MIAARGEPYMLTCMPPSFLFFCVLFLLFLSFLSFFWCVLFLFVCAGLMDWFGGGLRARHLLRLRALQMRTGGITEFVPLPFVHMQVACLPPYLRLPIGYKQCGSAGWGQAPLYRGGRARRGPTMRECSLMHAIARLVLHPYITNIQVLPCHLSPCHAP